MSEAVQLAAGDVSSITKIGLHDDARNDYWTEEDKFVANLDGAERHCAQGS